MFSECLLFFIYFIFSITLFYTIGKIITRTILNKKYTSSFYSLTFGILFIVLIVSLYITNLKTIHLFTLIPIGLIIYLNKNKIIINNPFKRIDTQKELKSLLKLYAAALPLFIVASITFFQYDIFPYQMQHHDFFAYSKYGQGIFESGNENYYRESNVLFPKIFNGLNPYHYFEIWLNIFLGNLFNVSYIKSLLLISFPLLQLSCLFGIIELIKSIAHKKYKFIILLFFAFILIFIEPIFFEFYNNHELLKYHEGFCNTSPLSFGRKYAAIFMFTILFFLLYSNKNKKEGFILLSSLPIISIGLLPGLCLGSVLYFLLNILTKKNYKYLFYLIYTIFFSSTLLVFYKLNIIEYTQDVISEKNFLSSILRDGGSIILLKKFIFLIIFPSLRTLLFFSIYLVVLFFLLRKSFRTIDSELIKLFLLIIISGAFGAGFAFELPDSGQLLYNCIPLLNILVIYLFIKSLNISSIHRIVILLPLICSYNAINNYFYINEMNSHYHNDGYKFLNNCLKEIEETNDPLIGYIYNENFSNINPHLELYRSPGIPFEFANNNPISICLNNPENIDNSGFAPIYKYMWPFYIFSLNNNSLQYNELLTKFLKEFNVDYLLIQGLTIPSQIDQKLILLAHDKNSNFMFYKIDVMKNNSEFTMEKSTNLIIK